MVPPPTSPPPKPPGPPAPRHAPGEDLDVEERTKTESPRRFKVVFHNDDYTTMEFVVHALRSIFRKSDAEAVHVMLTVHRTGAATAGIYPRDVAETKAEQTMELAREQGMPLLLTTEPE